MAVRTPLTHAHLQPLYYKEAPAANTMESRLVLDRAFPSPLTSYNRSTRYQRRLCNVSHRNSQSRHTIPRLSH